ncbi:MAG: PAS domain S-box protein [Candidatus Omnitrophota bacterium]|jgi:PAS domain S-box-containing protein
MTRGEKTKEQLLRKIENLETKVRELETAQSVYKQEARSARVFKKIADRANYGVAISDLDGQIVYVNKVFSEMHGYEPDEAIGKEISFFHSRDQLKEVDGLIRKLKKKGSFVSEEVWHKKKDETVFPTLMNAAIIKNEKGKPLFMTTTAIDITESKLAEEALKKSEEKYRLIAENTSDLIAVMKFDGTYTYISPSHDQLGYKPEDLLGKSGLDMIHPDDRKNLLPLVNKYAQDLLKGLIKSKKIKEIHEHVEFRFPDAKGKWRDIEATADLMKSLDDGGYNILLVSRDITGSKRVRKDLKKLQHAINQSPSIVMITDPKGVIEYVNPKFTQVTGYTQKEALGKNAEDLGITSPEDKQDMWSVLNGGREWRGEFTNKKKSGEIYTEFAAISSVRNEKGAITHFIKVAEDITEKKRAEDALKNSEERWRSLVENAPDFIFILDREGKVKFINHTTPDYVVEEVIGSDHIEYVHPEFRNLVRKTIESVFQTGEPASYETKGAGPRGSASWYEAHVGPIKQGDRIVAVTVLLNDITVRKNAEKAIKESEEKFRTIFDNANDGILLADAESKKFFTGNNTLCRMLGYTHDEIKDLGVEDIHPREDLPHVIDQFEKQMRKEITLAKDIPVKRKDGSVLYADINSSPVVLGGKSYLLGMFRDVTERKEAEFKLRQQRELLDNTNKELQKKIEEVQTAMKHIKRLEGLVPICARCKKIRVEGKGAETPEGWVSLEKYISEKTEASLTHGLCPDCARELYKRSREKNE